MGATQQFSLRWNNYVQHITCAFDTLRCDEDLVDVTLSCEGKRIFAHKMLLSACSNYFKDVFKENPCKHPVIIFRNVKFEDLLAIIDFMYHGEVNVEQEQLSSFLTTAEMLAVQGLTGATRDEPPSRKSGRGTPMQELSINRQSNHKLPSRPVSTQNLPSNANFVAPTSPRPSTPVQRKRRLSPPIKMERDEMSKRRAPDTDGTLILKEEVEFEEDGSFDEQEALMEDSQLELSRDLDGVSPNVTTAASPPSETVTEKVGVGELKAGPSAGVDGQGGEEEDVDAEVYFEPADSVKSDGAEGEVEGELAYVLMTEDGYEVIDPATLLTRKDGTLVSNITKEGLRNDLTFLVNEEETIDGEDAEEGGTAVEYIYAEAISENNEIVIGEIPKFECNYCVRSFKRLDSLQKHLRLHEGQTTCPACSAVFSRVAHRTRHIKLKHPELAVPSGSSGSSRGRTHQF